MHGPNFFLIGAPRCGTTALARYLSEHSRVFFTNPKEPHYWCADAPGLRSHLRINCEEDYARLFAGVSDEQWAVGEGSTEYLRSRVAIPAILARYPQARFIAMVRNPVDLVVSFHGMQVYTLSEAETDFERAWRLQRERARGDRIPSSCLDPCLLRYGEVGHLGEQVERLFAVVPAAQRRVWLFDDFVADPGSVYREVLDFLGLPDDGRMEFPRVHESRRQRWGWAHKLVRRPPGWLVKPMWAFRRWMNSHCRGPIPWLKRQFWRPLESPALRREFREELQDYFAAEVEKLERLLDRDLSRWKQV